MISRPTVADTAEIAACHVQCWREAYAGLLSVAYLDALDVVAREAMWHRVLSGPAAADHAVAVVDGRIVGFAAVRASRDDPAPRERELWAIYVVAASHGTGIGQRLLDSVLGDSPASLWVAEGNPRARAFYARNGFLPDGARRVVAEWEHLPIVRLVR